MMKNTPFNTAITTTCLVLLSVLSLMPTSKIQAQKSMLDVRDSLGKVLNIAVLTKEILIAGDLYKINKYKLTTTYALNPDTLLAQSMHRYQELFISLPKTEQAKYFTDSFYSQIIPVVQYFRYVYFTGLLMEHQKLLHPQPSVHDPKHHDTTHHDHID